MKSVNFCILWSNVGKSRLVACVVISQRPNLLALPTSGSYLVSHLLCPLDLIYELRSIFPADGHVATDAWGVHHVAIQNDCARSALLRERHERLVHQSGLSGPVMEI